MLDGVCKQSFKDRGESRSQPRSLGGKTTRRHLAGDPQRSEAKGDTLASVTLSGWHLGELLLPSF